LTALSQRNEAKLQNAGASAYIEKSSLDLVQNAEALIQTVESVLSRSAAVSSAESPS